MAENAGEPNPFWMKQIVECIEGLKYGHVQITVHDGRIVQIDRLERKRFAPSVPSPESKRTNKQGNLP